jgi:hypothetical protein
MHKIDHAAILFAYLSRISNADMENILKHDTEWLNATLEDDYPLQAATRAGMYAAVANAVNNLIDVNVSLIEKTLKGFKPNI